MGNNNTVKFGEVQVNSPMLTSFSIKNNTSKPLQLSLCPSREDVTLYIAYSNNFVQDDSSTNTAVTERCKLVQVNSTPVDTCLDASLGTALGGRDTSWDTKFNHRLLTSTNLNTITDERLNFLDLAIPATQCLAKPIAKRSLGLDRNSSTIFNPTRLKNKWLFPESARGNSALSTDDSDSFEFNDKNIEELPVSLLPTKIARGISHIQSVTPLLQPVNMGLVAAEPLDFVQLARQFEILQLAKNQVFADSKAEEDAVVLHTKCYASLAAGIANGGLRPCCSLLIPPEGKTVVRNPYSFCLGGVFFCLSLFTNISASIQTHTYYPALF